jgi:predicted dehydrogenase
MSKLKVALLGGYGHTGSVVEEMKGLEEAELVACALVTPDEDLDWIRQHPVYHEGVRWFDDYHEMLREVQPEVTVVGARLDQMATASVAAARAGSHIITEKPLAITHEDLFSLWETIQENGVQLIAELSMRAQPPVNAAKHLYDMGVLGEVAMANALKSYRWGERPEWYGKRSLYGGTIGWVGIHALDFITYITGETYTRVAAMQSNFNHPERPECEDNCVLVLEMSNGAHASVTADYLRPSGAPTHGDHWVRIAGTRGVVLANVDDNTCCYHSDAEADALADLGEPLELFRPFLLSLRGGPPQTAQRPAEAFHLTHACLCARDAADQGEMLPIPPGPWFD